MTFAPSVIKKLYYDYDNVKKSAPISNGQFSFVVTDANGSQTTATCDANGNVAFPSILVKYDDVPDEGATYTYTIKEVKGTDSTITSWDDRTVTATVKVSKDLVAKTLSATVTYSGGEGTSANEFVNKQDKTTDPDNPDNPDNPADGSYQLVVYKKLYYNYTDSKKIAAITNGQFEFTLTDGSGNEITATCDSSGKVSFPAYALHKADITSDGLTRVYTIKEVKGSDSSIVTWDTSTVTATVKAWTDTASGEIKTNVVYSGGSGDLSNNFVNEKDKSTDPDNPDNPDNPVNPDNPDNPNNPDNPGDGGNNGGNNGGNGGNSGSGDNSSNKSSAKNPIAAALAKTGGTIVPILILAQIAAAVGIAVAYTRRRSRK